MYPTDGLRQRVEGAKKAVVSDRKQEEVAMRQRLWQELHLRLS